MRRTHSALGPALFWGAALIAVAWAGGVEARPQGEGDRALSAGDIRFHARAVAYRHAPKEARADFSIRIPYREIYFVPQEDRFAAKLRLTVEMWSPVGNRVGYLQREAILESTDLGATRDSLLGEVYSVGLTAAPGQYTFKVLVEDMNVARQGLVYKMKNQKRQGEVVGSIDMGDWLFRDPTLSGLEFAWEIGPAVEGSPFKKGSYDVKPHPSAQYGHFQDAVAIYYEIYDAPPPPGGKTHLLATRVLNGAGDTLFASIDSLRVSEGTAWPHALAIDVSSFEAGHYRMILTLEDGRGRSLAHSEEAFDIIWSLESWRADAVDVYEVTATALLSSDSAQIFRELPLGEKERWIERIWRNADPTPETGENERRDEFRRRVAFTNAHYSVLGRGMFSDRGRVYIRYGEPDDIKIERVPVAGKTLGYALEDQIPKASREKVTDTRSGVADLRAYEIWTYEMHGRELVPRYGMNEISAGMKFVFADEQGFGEYTLRYSSTSGIH